MDFDYIVVGGGSSGCVVANRLSATGRNVLLIEAGMDTPPGSVPDDILDANPTRAYFNKDYKWSNLKATFSYTDRKPSEYEQAKVLGGGSSINAQVANRGGPGDYDEWAELGASGWAWEDVLPYFRKLETDHDFDGHYHGKDGLLPIKRVRKSDWSGFIKGVAGAYDSIGLHERADFNGEFGDGYSTVPLSNFNGQRVSTAIAYLSPEVRKRPNLKIETKTVVEALTIEANVVTGVKVRGPNGSAQHRARTVVMCAGALHTPAILMRSGIGDPAKLINAGISVRAEVRGVGRNLQEHPSIAVSAYLPSAQRMRPDVVGHIQLHARYSSMMEGCPQTDMAISAVAKSAWHPLGKRLGSLQLWVNRSYSTGELNLVGPHVEQEPTVDFNWLSDKRDLDRLKEGVRRLARVFDAEALRGVALDAFPSAWNARSKAVSRLSKTNYVLTGILAKMLDSSAFARKQLIQNLITQGVTLDQLVSDDAALEAYVLRNVTGNWHPTSTCKMGSADDPMAVSDNRGRVRSVSGLRIADASAMPFCPRANTNIPTIMLAEKMSDLMIAEETAMTG